MVKVMAVAASIRARAARSEKAVSPGLGRAINDVPAKTRVIAAAAANQRCRWNRLIRPNSMGPN